MRAVFEVEDGLDVSNVVYLVVRNRYASRFPLSVSKSTKRINPRPTLTPAGKTKIDSGIETDHAHYYIMHTPRDIKQQVETTM